MERICPYCKKDREVTELEVGILKAKYKCDSCKGVFERDTYFKQTAAIALGVLGLFFGGHHLGGDNNQSS
jgi:ribosomal protein L37AE/L43A